MASGKGVSNNTFVGATDCLPVDVADDESHGNLRLQIEDYLCSANIANGARGE